MQQRQGRTRARRGLRTLARYLLGLLFLLLVIHAVMQWWRRHSKPP